MSEILNEFKSESAELLEQLNSTLDECEGDFTKCPQLETYGQVVDRIMGAAKTISMLEPDNKALAIIAQFAEIGKVIGYKGSQIGDNETFYNVVVAFLFDTTEVIENALAHIDNPAYEAPGAAALKQRLEWLEKQFSAGLRSSVGVTTNTKANASAKGVKTR